MCERSFFRIFVCQRTSSKILYTYQLTSMPPLSQQFRFQHNLPGRTGNDVRSRWHNSLWDYERTHPGHLQGHATILVKHFVSEDHDGMNLSGLYTAYAHQEGAPVYYCQLDNEQVAYIRRLSNRWHIVLQQQPQLPLYSSAPDTASLPPKDTWARYNCDGPELELFY